MLATSDEVIAAWLSPARQLSIRVKVGTTTYGSEDVTSLSFDSGSISGEVYQIGSTYMNTVQIVFPSIIETIKEDQEVIPELGILVDGEYHYSKLGHFFITEFNRDRNAKTTTITASDKMIYMEGVYESKLTYSKPYREVALEIANLAGVEINQASFASLGTLAIKKPVGYTYRQAIGLIAQFEGGFASFNRDGELEIRRLRPTDFEVTPESYLLKGFTKNENAYRIGGITVRIGEEETDVLRVGSTNGSQIELENKVMTKQLLNNMWELVKTLNYFPFELKWRGSPVLEAGDWMYVTDRDGNRYSVPNLSYSLTFNGGLSGESKATTNSSSQATYKYRGSLKQKVDWLDSILSANNWNSNYHDATEPTAPKEGDAWFKPNGQDIEIWLYEKDAEGNLDWVFKISTATDPALIALIEENKRLVEEAQTAAEDAQKAGEDAQKVADEAKDKADQAGVDAGQALDKANDAVSKANDATAKVGGLETAVGLVTEQSANAVDVANQAKGNADTALGKANSAIGTAQDALNQSALAKSQAEEAIEKYLGMGVSPAWSWSPDGTDRFTTSYPRENLQTGSNTEFILKNEAGDGSKKTLPFSILSDDIIGKKVILSVEVEGRNMTNRTGTSRIGYELFTPRTDGKTTWLGLWEIVNNISNLSAKRVELAIDVPTNLVPNRLLNGKLYIQVNGEYIRAAYPKFEVVEDDGTSATIYTPAPSEDYANAIPSYIGFAIEPSDNPDDYTWIRNPEKVEGEVKVELTEINGELSRKVSQETFDQLNSTVINHSTLISQNQNAIKLKADQSTVDTINQTVADHSTAIDLNAEAIALKANQSTVDSLTGRVTEAEGSITTIAGQVALKANQSVVDTMTNTVNANSSELTVQAGKITALTTKTDGHTSQISSLGDAINLRVEKDDIINQININDQGVLIAGEKVHITGLTTIDDAVIKTANIVDLNVTEAKLGNLSVSTAKIADAAITSAKIGTAAIGTAHIGDGVITNAKIGNLAVSGAKIQDATISSAKIINLDASKITANTLSAITTDTGTLNVSGWLTMATENRGILGSYDFGDAYGQAYNYRWFVGEYRFSHRHLYFSAKSYNVTTSDTKGTYRYDTETFYGPDYVKMRQYKSTGALICRSDINADKIAIGGSDWANSAYMDSSGFGYFSNGAQVNGGNGLTVGLPGLNVGRINAPDSYDTLIINNSRTDLPNLQIGGSNFYINNLRSALADFRVGKDGSSINGGRVVQSSAVYKRTYSGTANMIVLDTGTIGRTTSARKYKADIQPAYDVIAKAKKVLELNPSSWWDKGELADGVAKERYYGFIADEFAEVGLNEVVVYRDGEIESLAYDRIPMYHNVILSEHEKEIQELKAKVQQLENEIRVLQTA